MKTAWKLGLRQADLERMSLREFVACRQAHEEYHGNAKRKAEPISPEKLRELGIEGA